MEPQASPECQADGEGPCEGVIMEYDGYFLCWHHHELFNTDGIHVKGIPWLIKRDWGDAPEWVRY